MEEINNLKQEIEEIKLRNKRVETDKKWETCLTRKICICIMTYIIVFAYSFLIKNITTISIFLSSFIPVIGFFLSTLSLKFIRKIWEKNLKQ